MMPRYIGLQDPNPVAPPFHFTGMFTQVFPLRAKLDALQQFVDGWLNFVPPEVGRFRAFTPYVNLMLIDYGRMAAMAANAGWCSQQEVMFTLPLEWYEVRDGKWVFRDWVWLSPFIFVDNEVSMTLGRTVWGWPKSLVQPLSLDGGVASNSGADKVVTRLGTWVYPHLYAGSDLQLRPFLEVRAESAAPTVEVPPTGRSPFAPWNLLESVSRSSLGFVTDAQRWVGQFVGRDIPALQPEALKAMLGRLLDPQVRGRATPATFWTLNLKQFRSSTSPDQYCYQALTVAPMRMTSFNRAGVLGEGALVAGEISGGYTVEIREWPSLPIVETLGLDVTSRRRAGDVTIARLSPVAPYWYDVDMDYNLGEVLAERAVDRVWRPAGRAPAPSVAGPTVPPRTRPAPALHRVDEPRPARAAGRTPRPAAGSPAAESPDHGVGRPSVRAEPTPLDARFNTGLGAAGQAMAGPFLFPDLTMRVLPLLARRERVEAFVEEALNRPIEGTPVRFRLWIGPQERTATVYLCVCAFGPVASSTNNVGTWAREGVQFLVPVIMEHRTAKGWELRSVGYHPAFAFTDTATASITSTEVFGVSTATAQFESPGVDWMEQPDPQAAAEQLLLRVSGSVTPALGLGTEVVQRPFIEVGRWGGAGPVDAESTRLRLAWALEVANRVQGARRTATDHADELHHARALSLEALVRRAPLRTFCLKEFRDAADPQAACYQSLTMIPQHVEELLDLQEAEGPLFVRIHQYPAMPVAERLGLIPWGLSTADGDFRYTFPALRPFFVRVRLRQQLGTRILWRSGGEGWTLDTLPQPWVAEATPGLALSVDEGNPSNLALAYLAWLERGGDGETYDRLTPNSVERTIERCSPHLVLDSLLSREWGRPAEGALWHTWVQDRQRVLARQKQDLPFVDRPERGWLLLHEDLERLSRRRDREASRVLPAQISAGLRLAGLVAALNRTTPADPAALATGGPADPAVLVEEIRAAAAAAEELWCELAPLCGGGFPRALRALLALGPQTPPVEVGMVVREARVVAEPLDQRLHHHVLVALSKAAQRHDHCARRSLAGAAAGAAFPLSASDGPWYVGPDAEDSADTGTSSALAEGLESMADDPQDTPPEPT